MSEAENIPVSTASKREKVLRALLETDDFPEAAVLAGCSLSTIWRWSGDADFVKELHTARSRQFAVEGATLGRKVLFELARCKETPAAVKASVAKTLVGLGGHAEASAAAAMGDGAPAALLDMTEDQLRQTIAAAESALGNRAQIVPAVVVAPAVAPDPLDIASLL